MKIQRLMCVAALWSGCALAQAPAVQVGEMCDPCVPPALRNSPVPKRASVDGPAFRSEVEQRLRVPFDAAARDGVLTREQAAAAGLGFIVRNFAAIDRSGRGAIRFEDYKAFLKERGAALD